MGRGAQERSGTPGTPRYCPKKLDNDGRDIGMVGSTGIALDRGANVSWPARRVVVRVLWRARSSLKHPHVLFGLHTVARSIVTR